MDHTERVNGLDLFSGIGGISLALEQWVRPVAYCENDQYAQGVLISRMADGSLPRAPIWDDVRTLRAEHLPAGIDIIYGGFPCQDISVAGSRIGITGERSGLVREVWRLVDEIRPRFVFLENVPAIVTNGFDSILAALAERGFDARWLYLAAEDVGAWHPRERWWCLAYSGSSGLEGWKREGVCKCSGQWPLGASYSQNAHANGSWELQPQRGKCNISEWFSYRDWWRAEPNVVRVVHGLSRRMDRINCLGNSVVPQCAKEAFRRLMGIT